MFKVKSIAALFFATALSWGCSDEAMFSNKNDQLPNEVNEKIEKDEKNSFIKAFASAKEAEDEYMRLWEQEQLLTKNSDESMRANHEAELMLFYQKLFRFIVKKDIKNKEPYTIVLGLKVKSDDTITDSILTMERLPISQAKAYKCNSLCFELLINGEDLTLLNQLKQLQKTNDSLDKSAESLFPKIVLADKDTFMENELGRYCVETGEILIPKNIFSLTRCREILHEFAHFKQHLNGLQTGGILPKPLCKKCPPCPTQIALELDAEMESISQHPCPTHLIKLLESLMDTTYVNCSEDEIYKEITLKNFPYLSEADIYATACKYHHLASAKKWYSFTNNLRQRRMDTADGIINTCLEHLQEKEWPKKEKYNRCLGLINREINCATKFKKYVCNLKFTLCKKEKSPEKINQIQVAPSYPIGSKEYFEIICRALDIEQSKK
jgi:hypothetical protein